jgi:hypothetical protein
VTTECFVEAEGGEITLALKPTPPGQDCTAFCVVIDLPAQLAYRPLPRGTPRLVLV